VTITQGVQLNSETECRVPLFYGGENVKEVPGFTTFSIVYSLSAWC